jgi:predicted DsbA family dithiol-disulfide isomerase
MPVVIPVYFDYASSLCYIASRIVARLEAELDVVVRWRPVHIAAQYAQCKHGTLIGGDTRGKIERVAQETGVPLRIPACWLDSQAALEGAFFAEEHGRLPEYHRGVFAAAYEGGEDIGERAILIRVADQAGLPVGQFMECLATRRTAPPLAATLEEARRHGVVGYPTFYLGEFPLTGIQPHDTMRLLFERHVERSRERLH